jgi:hypothetical protein
MAWTIFAVEVEDYNKLASEKLGGGSWNAWVLL